VLYLTIDLAKAAPHASLFFDIDALHFLAHYSWITS